MHTYGGVSCIFGCEGPSGRMTELLNFQVSSLEAWAESLYLSNNLHQRLFLHLPLLDMYIN